MFERDDQLAELTRLFSECGAGKGGVALVEGPFTCGRSELLRIVADRVRGQGAQALTANCSRAEQTLPLGAVIQLLHSADLAPDALTELIRLTDEATVAWTAAGAPTATFPLDVVLVFQCLSRAVLELAASTPVLIGIDDLGHADPLSLGWLLHLIRRIGSARVLVVLTDEQDPRPPQPPWRAELLGQPHFRRLTVAPLSGAGVVDLLAQRMDRRTAVELTPSFRAATGGNPLLLRALVGDHLQFGEATAAGYGLALLSCLHRGSPDLLPVARAIAVLGDGASAAELGQLTGIDQTRVQRAIREMAAAGLIDGGTLRHPVARAAVFDDMTAAQRAELRLCAAKVRHDGGAPASVVAKHLVDADEPVDAWAVPVLQEAATQALLAGRPELAVDCLRLAHRSSSGDAVRSVTLARLADAEWQVDPSAATRHLPELVASAHSGRLAWRDLMTLVRQLLWHGRPEEAGTLLTRMRGGDGPQRKLGDIELWLAVSHPGLAHRPNLALSPSGPPDSDVLASTDPQLGSAAMLAGLLSRGGLTEAVDRAEQVLRDIHLGRTTPWADESTMLALLVLVGADQVHRAAAWCEKLLSDNEVDGLPTWRAVLAAVRAEVALRQGELTAAMAHGESALGRLSLKAWGVAVGLPLGAMIMAATCLGQHDRAAALLTHAVPEAMFQSRYGLHYLHARGHHHLATNRYHAALADFLACGELMRTWGLDVAGLVPWRTSAAQAWLELGNRDQARRLLRDQLSRPDSVGVRVRGLSLRLLAAVAPPNRRLQPLTEALELLEASGDRFEQARVLTDLSRGYSLVEDNRRARLLFRRALHVAKICEAAPLVQELLSVSADGERMTTGAAPTEGIVSLTESQRRVAALAVMGYTNREIAIKLYITASTVEQHLTRVYRKLDIKHRKDLPVDLWDATRTG
ncbi:AAA family ATPase [Kutzneria sp. NPDC051319]|uniref:AAA family ATPase n=1 Tax=Kutzneria sp. NPDC051319 TaxID=3155047 RepID=UPI00343287C3